MPVGSRGPCGVSTIARWRATIKRKLSSQSQLRHAEKFRLFNRPSQQIGFELVLLNPLSTDIRYLHRAFPFQFTAPHAPGRGPVIARPSAAIVAADSRRLTLLGSIALLSGQPFGHGGAN